MCVSEYYNSVIVSLGIIGISAVIAALESRPSFLVLIVEKSTEIGEHASGRNLGFLHAGIYSSPDCLKARYYREGSQEIKQYAKNLISKSITAEKL